MGSVQKFGLEHLANDKSLASSRREVLATELNSTCVSCQACRGCQTPNERTRPSLPTPLFPHILQRGSTLRLVSALPQLADNIFTNTFPHAMKIPIICVISRTAIVGRMMHILPAGLWSAIGPLQLWPSFRLKHRTAHRRMGRLFIAMSVSISIGVVPIITSGATILYQVDFAGGRVEQGD